MAPATRTQLGDHAVAGAGANTEQRSSRARAEDAAADTGAHVEDCVAAPARARVDRVRLGAVPFGRRASRGGGEESLSLRAGFPGLSRLQVYNPTVDPAELRRLAC